MPRKFTLGIARAADRRADPSDADAIDTCACVSRRFDLCRRARSIDAPLAGQRYDGTALLVRHRAGEWSRERVRRARAAGRDPRTSDPRVHPRLLDEDEPSARIAFARWSAYALARPAPTTRRGIAAISRGWGRRTLTNSNRDATTARARTSSRCFSRPASPPCGLLGKAEGARDTFSDWRRLDIAVVRLVPARARSRCARLAMRACAPSLARRSAMRARSFGGACATRSRRSSRSRSTAARSPRLAR